MATLRSKGIRYPGVHGLNTLEATLSDEAKRFGDIVLNGIVDSAGRLTSRKEFTKQTTGFSNTLKSIYVHRKSNATEVVLSAAAGVIYSGVSALSSAFNYTQARQVVDVGGAKTGASATGLVNDATTYGVLVSVNGGPDAQVTVVGSAAQTYTALIAEISADLASLGLQASCALVGGNIHMFALSQAGGTSIAITNSAGAASVALLTTLTGFVAVRKASAGTVAQENWQYASFKGRIYLAQAGQHFTVLNEDDFSVQSIVGQPWSGHPNVVMSAYGRVWVADDEAGSNRFTIWWSNLMDGLTWAIGDAGNISLAGAWPKGQDSIVALAAAFGRLVVFGRRSILLYTLPSDNNPAKMTLTDVIEDMGCVARDSVMVTDTGIIFLSDNGIYRIDKLGQTTSLMTPKQVSMLYNDDVLAQITTETPAAIRAGFYPTEGVYLLSFPTGNTTFCVHTKKLVPDLEVPVGSTWNNAGRPFYGFAFDKDRNFYSAGVNGVHKYTGYTPDGASNAYNFTWSGQWMPIEDESRLKHFKSATAVVEAAAGQTGSFTYKLGYAEGTTFSNNVTCDAIEFAENPGVGSIIVPLGGSSVVIKPGLSFPINGNAVTLHQLRIYANPGKVVQR